MTAGEVITNAQREIDRLQEENRHLRADLADARAWVAARRAKPRVNPWLARYHYRGRP